jgi:hypothetical protein
MSLYPANNLSKVIVSTGYNSSATSIVLSSGQGALLPSITPYNLTWYDSTLYSDPSDDPNVEIVQATGISTDTLTITRAAESVQGRTPTAYNHNTAGHVYKMLLALTVAQLNNIANLIVGYRTTYQQFTTAGSDTSFVLTPPGSTTASGVQLLFIGGQQFAQGVGNDYTVSGNTITLLSTYQGGSGQPVLVVYTY